MRKVAVLAAAAALAAAIVAYVRWRGRSRIEPLTWSAADASPVASGGGAAHAGGAGLVVDVDAPSTAPDPEAREVESEVTGETRYDRLVEREREERRERAERVLDDPLTEKLEGDAERPS
jgi:hypothetical protein